MPRARTPKSETIWIGLVTSIVILVLVAIITSIDFTLIGLKGQVRSSKTLLDYQNSLKDMEAYIVSNNLLFIERPPIERILLGNVDNTDAIEAIRAFYTAIETWQTDQDISAKDLDTLMKFVHSDIVLDSGSTLPILEIFLVILLVALALSLRNQRKHMLSK